MNDFQSKLSAPFSPTAVSWRVGSTTKAKDKGMALAYIDARDVMGRLDEVVGAENWQDEYEETAKGRVFCQLSIRTPAGDWVTKSDGAGDTDYEGDKGAISDAFKRAAVKWGIGRYLYDLDSPWVEIEVRGNTAVITPAVKKQLQAMLLAVKQSPMSEPTYTAAFLGYATKELGMSETAIVSRLAAQYPVPTADKTEAKARFDWLKSQVEQGL